MDFSIFFGDLQYLVSFFDVSSGRFLFWFSWYLKIAIGGGGCDIITSRHSFPTIEGGIRSLNMTQHNLKVLLLPQRVQSPHGLPCVGGLQR